MDFLKIARRKYHDRLFWIDAICIDQHNNAQKASQVRRMDEIYANAEDVFIWLGKYCELNRHVDRNLATQFQDLKALSKIKDEDGNEVDNFLRKTFNKVNLRFFNMSYWSRAWIIQEIILSKRRTIFYGLESVEWDTLQDLWQSEVALQGIEVPENVRFSKISKFFVRKEFGPQHWEYPPLRVLFQDYGDVECLEFHDRVYALLALSSERSFFPVDYDVSRTGLFLRTLRICGLGHCLCWAWSLTKALQPNENSAESKGMIDDKFVKRVNQSRTYDEPWKLNVMIPCPSVQARSSCTSCWDQTQRRRKPQPSRLMSCLTNSWLPANAHLQFGVRDQKWQCIGIRAGGWNCSIGSRLYTQQKFLSGVKVVHAPRVHPWTIQLSTDTLIFLLRHASLYNGHKCHDIDGASSFAKDEILENSDAAIQQPLIFPSLEPPNNEHDTSTSSLEVAGSDDFGSDWDVESMATSSSDSAPESDTDTSQARPENRNCWNVCDLEQSNRLTRFSDHVVRSNTIEDSRAITEGSPLPKRKVKRNQQPLTSLRTDRLAKRWEDRYMKPVAGHVFAF